MAYPQAPTVRLERQPHRDAIIRVREAYRRLQRSQRQPEPEPVSVAEADVSPAVRQEVRV
jgi:hypothetical protein